LALDIQSISLNLLIV